MKKFLALTLALLMVLALAACGSKTAEDPAPAEEEPAVAEEAAPAEEEPAEEEAAEEAAPAEDDEVTWADYQAYLIEKAGGNSPDPDEFKAQVEALSGWEDIDQTAAPWNLMFTTIGLSTWEAFQGGERNEPLVTGGPDASASGEGSGEPSAEPAGGASGEPAAAPAADGEVTWADYQAYLIEKAGANAPDLEEFKAQVEAIGSWDELDQTVSPWDLMFTTIGLSTWEEFQQGIVKEPAVSGGPDASASGEGSGEPTAEPAA